VMMVTIPMQENSEPSICPADPPSRSMSLSMCVYTKSITQQQETSNPGCLKKKKKSVWMLKPNMSIYSYCRDAWSFSAVASSVLELARAGRSRAGEGADKSRR
jgi:hypothetical protein